MSMRCNLARGAAVLQGGVVGPLLDRGDGGMATMSSCDDRAMVEDAPIEAVIVEFRDPDDWMVSACPAVRLGGRADAGASMPIVSSVLIGQNDPTLSASN